MTRLGDLLEAPLVTSEPRTVVRVCESQSASWGRFRGGAIERVTLSRAPKSALLALPADRFARTSAHLGDLSDRELRAALAVEIDALSPFALEETIVALVRDRETADLMVARHSDVLELTSETAPWRTELGAQRTRVLGVMAEGVLDRRGRPALFQPVSHAIAHARRPGRAVVVILVAAVAAAGAVVAGAPLWKAEQRIAALSTEVMRLEREAERAVALRAELAKIETQKQSGELRFQNVLTSRVIAAVSNAAPDDTVLSEFVFDAAARSVTLTGAAQDANELAPRLEAAAIFQNVRLEGETRRQSSDREQFRIIADIVGGS